MILLGLYEVKNKVKDKLITHDIFRTQDDDSIICGFYCVDFIDYVIAEKTLLNYTNSFSPNDYKENDKIIYKYIENKYDKVKRKSWL